MARYLLSNNAIEDLSRIWEYTFEEWSERQADKYYYMLLETCQDLADGNSTGKAYPEIGSEILGFKAGHHIIFYRRSKKFEIEVSRILHDRMDFRSRIDE